MQEKGEKADEKTACRENVEDRGRYFDCNSITCGRNDMNLG